MYKAHIPTYYTQMKLTETLKCTCLANASSNAIQLIFHLLTLGSHWVSDTSHWVHDASRWVRKAFGYQHVGIGSAKVLHCRY